MSNLPSSSSPSSSFSGGSGGPSRGSSGGSGGDHGGILSKSTLIWRQRCDRLEQENHILRATNRHLKLLLKNATSEISSLKLLVTELEETCQKPGALLSTSRLLDDVNSCKEEEDGTGPLAILPEEIWEKILNHLQSSLDIQSFCRAYPSWDLLLHRSKPSWLFDQVFPLVHFHLDRPSILKSRLVCHRWRNSIDHFLTNNPVRRPSTPAANRPILRLRNLSTWLHLNHFFSNLITSLKSELLCRDCPSSRNPLLGHHASFSLTPDCPQLIPFLQRFGHHLFYLRLDCRHNGASWLFWQLVELLPLVPNLRKLDISLHPIGAPVSGLVPSYIASLESQWRLNHLPPLPSLETLEISEHDLFHGALLKNVLISTYSPTIKRLGLNQYCIPPESPRLPILTELTLSVDTDLQLSSLLRLTSPVQRLTLYVTYNDHDPEQDYPSIGILFRCINHFRSTLKSLYIQLPPPHSTLDWNHLPVLDLPNLTTLSLRECTSLSFNLLLALSPSLQYLHLYSYRLREGVSPVELGGGNNEHLDIHQCLQRSRSLYKSNLWEQLGKLREVTVTVEGNDGSISKEKGYNRQIWEKICRSKHKF